MHATRAPHLLRIPDAAQRLNVSRASLYRWIAEGRVPAVQLGGPGAPLRIPEDELEAWLYREPPTAREVAGSTGAARSPRGGLRGEA
jgi:excisionase family DNA binding protein